MKQLEDIYCTAKDRDAFILKQQLYCEAVGNLLVRSHSSAFIVKELEIYIWGSLT